MPNDASGWESGQLRQLRTEFQATPELAAEAEGTRVLAAVEQFITKYVVLPAAARLVIGLWAMATYLAECFDSFPYLSLSSPLPRCGKTRVLEVLELLTARPWRGTAPTEAALFRYIEAKKPTLLLDEVEGLNAKKASERDTAVLAILNAGYKKGQTVPRCVGASHRLQEFHVYGPKAFACIGSLPATLKDRSIVIPMQRRGPGEKVERFRFERSKKEATPIAKEAKETVKSFASEIAATYASLPELSFLSDRDEELFAPLFSVCAVLAPERVAELRECARKLCDTKTGDAVDDSLPMRVLADVRKVWPEDADAMFSEALLGALRALPESPWAEEVKLTPRSLARRLRGFDVRPRTVRVGEGQAKGYVREELVKAYERYLPPGEPKPESEASHASQTA
jgi:hypothetical protein